MIWPKGTVVQHEFMGTYIVDGPSFPNEIGYIMVPVLDIKGKTHYFEPKNLKPSRMVITGNSGIFRTPIKTVKARFKAG